MSAKNFPRQCFRLGGDVFGALSLDEVDATWTAMEEVGIAQPPYPEYDLMIPSGLVFTASHDNMPPVGEVIFRYRDGQMVDMLINREYKGTPENFVINEVPFFSLLDKYALARVTDNWKRYLDKALWTVADDMEFVKRCRRNAGILGRLLIVLLATRNVEKTQVVDKLAKMGIGRAQRHMYTTTLTIGRVTEVEEGSQKSASTGRTLRPHLRRGYSRRQHYGPKNQFVKSVFIEACFVNADEDFVNARVAYNVALGAEP